jgi:hypothetical protein
LKHLFNHHHAAAEKDPHNTDTPTIWAFDCDTCHLITATLKLSSLSHQTGEALSADMHIASSGRSVLKVLVGTLAHKNG